jgi:hypothetical protein
MENIISEFRVVETDDGFRIEIKGDKEKLRRFFTGAAGPGAWGRGHGFGHRGPRGPFGFMPWMGPWWAGWGYEPGEEQKGDQPKEA